MEMTESRLLPLLQQLGLSNSLDFFIRIEGIADVIENTAHGHCP